MKQVHESQMIVWLDLLSQMSQVLVWLFLKRVLLQKSSHGDLSFFGRVVVKSDGSEDQKLFPCRLTPEQFDTKNQAK